MEDILKKLLDKYDERQMVVAIEELSELQKELCKSLRGKGNEEHIMEEMADVCIMLCQIMLYYNFKEDDIKKIIEQKIKRTEERFLGAQNGQI